MAHQRSLFDTPGDPRALLSVKALTVRQPWASLIISGEKSIENRARRTNYRGLLLVHAGRRDDPPMECAGALPRGAIIGSVRLVDCVRDSPSEWAVVGAWHWVLADPRAFDTPIPCTGQLGLWRPSLSVAAGFSQ